MFTRGRVSSLLKRLRAERRGNAAIIFALSAFPILLGVGLAVDTSRAVHHRTKLATALDAAGLAAGASFFESDEDIETIAKNYLKANLGAETYALVRDIKVGKVEDTLHLSADMDVPTIFMGMINIDSTPMSVKADIVRENKKLEVALVLDNTGSMAGDKIASLRNASEDLIEILFGEETDHPLLRVALVPYVTAVNIRGEGYKESWIDWYAESDNQGENFDLWNADAREDLGLPDLNPISIDTGARVYEMHNGDRVPHSLLYWAMEDHNPNAAWKGCVEARPAPYDVNDAAPDASAPNSLFTPYLWPDEPEAGGSGADYDNNYINDGSGNNDSAWGSTYAAQQSNFVKYAQREASVDNSPSTTGGPNKSCARPITPLSSKRDDLLDEIEEMTAWNDGGTNGAAGMAWGWRVLSPGEPYTEGAGYDDERTEKVMVMMTDGANEIYGGWDNHNNSHYNAYNYLAKERLGSGVNTRNEAVGVINARMETLCENIKAEGITMYTITFRQNNSSLKQLYRDCASSPDHYFDSTSNGELEAHFQTIARQLSKLRIAR